MHILLELGDRVAEGDELYDLETQNWWPAHRIGPDFPYRNVGDLIVKDAFPVRRHLEPWEAVKHALESIPDTDATTTQEFWDCECKVDFIRRQDDDYCMLCGAERSKQPDARLREVLLTLMREKLL